MPNSKNDLILVINTGSSSLKFGVYANHGGDETLVLDGEAEGIGRDTGKLEVRDARGTVLRSEARRFEYEADALDRAAQWLPEFVPSQPAVIGHRVVHGGPRLVAHQRITPEVMEELARCVHFAPLHIPVALELIRKSQQAYPDVLQFACFDTAFHRTIPEEFARFPLPRSLYDEGIRRYGFHGLSYESLVHALGKDLLPRTVMAHLGSGASLAAVRDGRSVDTTMGLTPTGGIPMATRSGDLDPGILLYLLRVKRMDADALETMLNHSSGLAGLSGGEGDMRDLQAAAKAREQQAQLAIEVFCANVRKAIAAFAAVLGGLDMLIFSGGIGENSAEVRSRVCGGLQFLGISSVSSKTEASGEDSERPKVLVRTVPSQEDLQIARHCRAMMR